MNTEQENGKDIYEGDIIINHIGMVAGFATAAGGTTSRLAAAPVQFIKS